MTTRRRRPTQRKTPLPKGIREIHDQHGNIRAYQARLEGIRGPDGKRSQPRKDFALDKGGLAAAVTWHAEKTAERAHGLFSATWDDRTTLLEFCRHYVAFKGRTNRAVTTRGTEQVIRTAIAAHPIAAMRLNAVKKPHVEAWLDDIARTRNLTLSTLHQRRNLLAAIYNLALDEEFPGLARNPVRAVKLPPVPPREITMLSVEQVIRLAAALSEVRDVRHPHASKRGAVAIVLAGLGLRISEGLGLRTGDFRDWLTDHPSVRIETQLRLEPGSPRDDVKTGHTGRRTIPVDPLVKATLDAHMAAYPPLRSDDPDHDGLIFHTRYGGAAVPYRSNPLTGLRAVVEELHAQDPTFPLLPSGTRTHILRYHYGSEMVPRTGGNLAAVARAMGHANVQQLINTYLRPTSDAEDRLRKASAARWEDPTPGSPGQPGASRGTADGSRSAFPVPFDHDSGPE